jgi:hypothetical protein
MAYTVKYRGLTVLCDGLDDVDRLADRQEASKPEPQPSIKNVVAEMGEGPQKLLGILLDEKDLPISSETLCKRMNLVAEQLPGKITGVTFPIRQAGFKPILLSSTNGNGKRQYWLDPDMTEEVREGIRRK